MTFTCPHFDLARNFCLRLHADCVPGRPGCVLAKNSVFAVPAAERVGEGPRRRRKPGSGLQHKGTKARRP